jgi:dTDP-4-dehydrorhamnose reductase
VRASSHDEAPILLTGMGGVLGAGLARGGLADKLAACRLVLLGRRAPQAWQEHRFESADLAVPGQLADWVRTLSPRAVLHAAALSRTDDCEQNPELADRLNAEVVRELTEALQACEAESSAQARIPLVVCSTDQVFDGTAASYAEDSPVSPIHAYGRSKAQGEGIALAQAATVLRLPLLLGPAVPGQPNKMGAEAGLIAAAQAGQSWPLFSDEWRAPADPSDLVDAIAKLLLGEARSGVFHLAGADAVSRHELGVLSCAAAGVDFCHRAASLQDWRGAPRPPRLILRCERAIRELGFRPPDLRQSLARLCSPAVTGAPAEED